MTRRNKNPKRKFGGLAEPVLSHKPLFVRASTAFVNNLTNLFRAGLILGALLFVQELDRFTDDLPAGDGLVVTEDNEKMFEVQPDPLDRLPVDPSNNERVRHAYNCTFTKYREKHFDECVGESSQVYRRPPVDEDEMGFDFRESSALFAGIID